MSLTFAFPQQQPKNIAELANYAFSFQSMAKRKFINKDVQTAYSAFMAFETAPNDITAITTFYHAAQTCAKDDRRTGFNELVAALEQKYPTLLNTSPEAASSTYQSPKL